jgi:hypothetical protein
MEGHMESHMESHVEGHVAAMWLPCEPPPLSQFCFKLSREARDMSAGSAQRQGGLRGSPPHNDCGAEFQT